MDPFKEYEKIVKSIKKLEKIINDFQKSIDSANRAGDFKAVENLSKRAKNAMRDFKEMSQKADHLHNLIQKKYPRYDQSNKRTSE